MSDIEQILQQSSDLHLAILDLLDDAIYSDSPRSMATLALCGIALEHADSFRLLATAGNLTSAVSLIRLQFEALTRAIWLLHAASDLAVTKLLAPLTVESEKAANNQPTIKEIIDQITIK